MKSGGGLCAVGFRWQARGMFATRPVPARSHALILRVSCSSANELLNVASLPPPPILQARIRMPKATYLKAGEAGAPGERPSARALAPREPLGAVYVGLLALVFLKLPYWAIRYAIASWRPIPSWSWGEALYISLVRQLIPFTLSKTALLTLDLSGDQEASFKPGPSGTPVWIPKLEKPLEGEMGEMMAKTGDRSVRVSAWWTGKDHAKQPDGKGKVILYMHGCVHAQPS